MEHLIIILCPTSITSGISSSFDAGFDCWRDVAQVVWRPSWSGRGCVGVANCQSSLGSRVQRMVDGWGHGLAALGNRVKIFLPCNWRELFGWPSTFASSSSSCSFMDRLVTILRWVKVLLTSSSGIYIDWYPASRCPVLKLNTLSTHWVDVYVLWTVCTRPFGILMGSISRPRLYLARVYIDTRLLIHEHYRTRRQFIFKGSLSIFGDSFENVNFEFRYL